MCNFSVSHNFYAIIFFGNGLKLLVRCLFGWRFTMSADGTGIAVSYGN